MKPPVLAGIGLGANLGHPIEAVRKAMQSLENLPETTLTAASRLYRTPAWGRTDQPDFINAAVLVQTRLSPQTLLSHLLAIERAAGRSRGTRHASMRWGPRVLDLDLLLYGDSTVNEPGLRVPHPHLHERAFALVPLAEIGSRLAFPGRGSVGDALRLVDASGVEALPSG